ncbi:MAG: N-acetylglucosaminyldiphosphoundecaprenol N-acetyl-beta-D-mannosaminyltransferase [Actinomycetota bacterium]|nr:N-acetylglucosaminyldiphosphoundecaprenol N-acetyl-beta-D-mannosaminyltransferase [Actinomycetota bacterium]
MITSPIPVDALSLDDVSARLVEARYRREHLIVSGLNAAVFNLAATDSRLAANLRRADLVIPDGVGVVWGWRLFGARIPERVATPDLVDHFLAVSPGIRVFVLGADEDCNASAAKTLTMAGARVVGRHSGFWSPGDEQSLLTWIGSRDPELILLGLPSPMKEELAQKIVKTAPHAIVIGVGGYLDILAGKTQRAPEWASRLGLEWLYRLMQEPHRLARRYLAGNALFLLRLVRCTTLQRRSRANRREWIRPTFSFDSFGCESQHKHCESNSEEPL